MRKSFFILLLFSLLYSLQGPYLCMAVEKAEIETNIGPFVTVSELEGEKSLRVLPLFGYEKDISKGSFSLDILWPLANYNRQKEKIQLRVFPFIYFKKDMELEWYKRKYLYVLPFYISGEKNGTKTRVLFPFYGHFEGWFGTDTLDMYMFPLYSVSSSNNGKTYNYCWPFVNRAVGSDNKGFRIWPLYGRSISPGEKEKEFILWPLYNRQKFFNKDGAIDRERLLLFPFYGSSRSESAETKFVMFPLYMGQKKLKEDYTRRDIIWPLFSYIRGKDRKTTQFFPFFRTEHKGDSFRNFYLWPLFWEGDIQTSGYRKRFFNFVPLYFYNRIEWENKDTDERLHKIWPLFSYRNDGNKMLVRSLELLPFNEKGKFGESFYKNIGSLFSIWEYSANTEEDSLKVSFLKGLFGYERKEEMKTFRFFYLPVYRSSNPKK